MSVTGIHRGYLRKYGGFLFKKWKEKFLLMTAEGTLLVCRDAESPPDFQVALHSSCEAILRGTDIIDLPRLPLGAERECCLALILREGEYLLLLATDKEQCRQWLSVLHKVRESASQCAPLRCCKRHLTPAPQTPSYGEVGTPTPEKLNLEEAGIQRGGKAGKRSSNCLRHDPPAPQRAVKAVCLMMGGAAVGSTLGYMITSATACVGQPAGIQPPDFKELGYHPAVSTQDPDIPQYSSFDFEGGAIAGGGQDFDSSFDYGGFAF